MSKPQIWSLLDIMREFEAWRFAELVRELTKYYWIATKRSNDGDIADSVVGSILDVLDRYQEQCRFIRLKASLARVEGPFRRALLAHGAITWGELKSELSVLWDALEPELSERRFAFIEATKGDYLDEAFGSPRCVKAKKRRGPSPVWLGIWKSFPSVKEECEEAVYCYGLERNTACVFHSMRIAEIGLRALARRMKVKLAKGGRLEWAEWQQVLKEMNVVCENIAAKMKKGPAKDELLEFYRGAIGQFYGFKDEFRNQVMHVRRSYDEFEAERALVRVRDFMGQLGLKINQRGRRI
jgi:hypothetical protein